MAKIGFKAYFLFSILYLISSPVFSQLNNHSTSLPSVLLIEWDKTMRDETSSSAREVLTISDGGYLIVGGFVIKKYLDSAYESKSSAIRPYSILKINSTGNVLWHKVLVKDKQLKWPLTSLLEGVYILIIKNQERYIFNNRLLKN